MIHDRIRISNKLQRVHDYILHNAMVRGDLPAVDVWQAAAIVDKLRRDARYQPTWQWEGFESEIDWAMSKY